jgi:DNA-binding transcriptional MerR regulator
MPYPSHIAATLSGAGLRQLEYWRSGGDAALLVPELPKTGGRVLYSFRDVVALRAFVYLRESVSLQRIRKAVENLRGLGNTDHLSRYRLVGTGRSIVLIAPGEAAIDLVTHPGAQRFAISAMSSRRSRTNAATWWSISSTHGTMWSSILRSGAGTRSSRAPGSSTTSSRPSYETASTRAKSATSTHRCPRRERTTPRTSPGRSTDSAMARSGPRENPGPKDGPTGLLVNGHAQP